jgi:hypothetical protein
MIVVRHAQEMDWVGQALDGDLTRNSVLEHREPDVVAMALSGGPAYSALVACGYVTGLLNCFEGDVLPDLVRLSGTKPLIDRGIWLLVLPELRRNATGRKVL